MASTMMSRRMLSRLTARQRRTGSWLAGRPRHHSRQSSRALLWTSIDWGGEKHYSRLKDKKNRFGNKPLPC